MLLQAAAEHDRHTSAVSDLVQGVEEGLAQITAAGEEAGLGATTGTAAAAGGGAAGGQDVDMEEGQVGERGKGEE